MNPINIGARRELFVDRTMIDTLDRTFLKMHEPIPMEKIIFADRPGEGGGNFGGTVFHLDGKHIMHYRALDMKDPTDMGKDVVAISEDGINWVKPDLRTTVDNCPVVSGGGFLDTRPGTPKSERIKGFWTATKSGEAHTAFNDPGGTKYLAGFSASEDGIHYHALDIKPDLETDLFNVFDGGCNMFWSEVENCYVFYFRYSLVQCKDPDKWVMRRSVARSTSADLVHWSKPVEMRYSDNPEQFYTNNTFPYYRAPHIYIALAGRFMEKKRVLTAAQAKACGIMTDAYFDQNPDNLNNEWLKDGSYTNYNDCSDTVLLTSRAGSCVYDRTFKEAFVRPGPEYGNWATRTNYSFGNLYQHDDTTMSFYVNRRYCQKDWHVQRMSIRIDGFASLTANWDGGTATTKPFVYDGNELEINYRTSAAGYIYVELLDEDGNLLPGFEAEACHMISGDEIKRKVSWDSDYYPEYSLSRYAGTPVRLRFIMKDADIFSFKFNHT